MRSRFVPVILSNADQQLARLAPAVGRGTPGWIVQRLCRAYRVRGCAAFFMSCRPAHLHGDLQRSGAAHAAWLEHAPEGEKVTGRAAPFFDAVAAADLQTARRIARGSSRTLQPDHELPEDFAYADLLMERFFRDGGGLAEALARFEAAVQGGESARLEVCRALLARDQGAFDEALVALAEEHRDFYAEGLRRGRVPEEDWAIDGCLFIEGLALVRLAPAAGLGQTPGVPLVPSLALGPPEVDLGPDTWRTP